MMNASPCLSLALAMAMPATSFAGPADGQPPSFDQPAPADRLDSQLIVRVEMEGGEALAEAFHGELLVSLYEEGASELPDADVLELVIATDAQSLDTYTVAYFYRGVTLETWTCACSGEELRARLKAATPAAWQAAVAAATPAPEPEPAVVAPPPPKDPGPAMGEPGHGMWLAGVGTTAVGTGLAVSQAVLLGLRASEDKATGLPIGLLATGVAMVATGAVLWGLGNRKRKRAHLGLSAGNGVVVTVQGRF